MVNCKECGSEFEPKNKKGIFCSDKCRQKDYRKSMAKLAKMGRESLTESAKKEISEVPISEFKKVQIVFPKGQTGEHKQAKKSIKDGRIKNIPFKAINKDAFDGEKINNLVSDEMGQWQEPSTEVKSRVQQMIEEQRKKLKNNQK